MKLARIAVAMTFLVVFAPGTIAFAQTSSDEALVRQAIDTYLHGIKFNDVASFQKVFLPEARLYFVKRDGTLGSLTQDVWYPGFAKNAGKEEAGTFSIVSVDITGNAASAKVKEVYPGSIYTNYVSLLKIGGSWKIVNKIFTAEKAAPAAAPQAQ